MADDLFGFPLRRLVWGPALLHPRSGSPALMDWLETPNAHEFKINVPGYTREGIQVQVEDGSVLHVKGESVKEANKGKDTVWHLAERGNDRGEFSRRIELPENVKLDQIRAQVDNGVLTVIVPKDATPRPPKVQSVTVTSKL